MKFLVTGGAGFIGSHLVEELAKLKGSPAIRILDNLTSGKERNLTHIPAGFELRKGDIRNLEDVRQAMQGVNIVFHHAALTSVHGSVKDPAGCNDVNVTGTLNVLMAAKDAGVSKVLFASSSAVYGENPVSPKAESLTPDPLSPYAASKLAGEVYCRMYSRLHGLQTVCFRYFNVFGPRQDPNSQYAAVIPKFAEAISAGRAPKVFGDGEQTRDFIFVKDIVQANILAALKQTPQTCTFNVGRGTSLSLNELLKTFKTLTGKDPKAEYLDAVQGDVKHSLADIHAIQSALGFAPTVTIEEGLRQTLAGFATAKA